VKRTKEEGWDGTGRAAGCRYREWNDDGKEVTISGGFIVAFCWRGIEYRADRRKALID
jgi:hypothetical protein